MKVKKALKVLKRYVARIEKLKKRIRQMPKRMTITEYEAQQRR